VIKKQKKNHLVASASAMVVLLLGSSSVAAWSLFNSDASKYRNECRKACVEDSFGRAQAREIQMRCSAKCDDLPLSPRDQWDTFDSCESNKERYNAFYSKNSSLLQKCESDLNRRAEQCRQRALTSSTGNTSRHSGGEDSSLAFHRRAAEAGMNAIRSPQFDEYVTNQCRDTALKALSSECRSVRMDQVLVDYSHQQKDCSRPTVARPR